MNSAFFDGDGVAIGFIGDAGPNVYVAFTELSGRILLALKGGNDDLCITACAGITESELGVLLGGVKDKHQTHYAVMRFDRKSLDTLSAAPVTGFHEYAIAEFDSELFVRDGWLAKQYGEDFWTVDRDGQATQVIPQLPTEVIGRSSASAIGDGLFAYSELRTSASGRYSAVVASDWETSRELIAVEGENWATARWTGSGVALIRGFDRKPGSYHIYDRTEVWYGVLPAGSAAFEPQVIGVHSSGVEANGELLEMAIAGHGYFVVALPAFAETPTGETRFRSFSIWNIANKSRRDISLEPGEALGGFLGVTAEHVYTFVADNSRPNRLKRYKLRAD